MSQSSCPQEVPNQWGGDRDLAMGELVSVSGVGPEGPFFNSEGRHVSEMTIDELDLEALAYKDAIAARRFNPHLATRFVIEATFGVVHEEQFEEQYAQGLGRLFEAMGNDRDQTALIDELGNTYSHFDETTPRLLEVLDAFRERQILPPEEMSTLTKLVLLVATQYG